MLQINQLDSAITLQTEHTGLALVINTMSMSMPHHMFSSQFLADPQQLVLGFRF
jgi:hypothetical protein